MIIAYFRKVFSSSHDFTPLVFCLQKYLTQMGRRAVYAALCEIIGLSMILTAAFAQFYVGDSARSFAQSFQNNRLTEIHSAIVRGIPFDPMTEQRFASSIAEQEVRAQEISKGTELFRFGFFLVGSLLMILGKTLDRLKPQK